MHRSTGAHKKALQAFPRCREIQAAVVWGAEDREGELGKASSRRISSFR